MPYADPEKRKAYHREYYRAYYHRRKDIYKKSRAKSKQANVAIIDEFKLSNGCKVCGYDTDPVALDLHHRSDDKILNVSTMAARHYRQQVVVEEMSKCDVLCANCHRILHHSKRLAGRSKKVPKKGQNDA